MLDKKTEDFLEKIAASGSTGMSQYKQRTVRQYQSKEPEGAAVGGGLGLAAGHLIGKNMKGSGNIARLAGLFLGLAAGRKMGKRGNKTKTTTIEGVVKKQQKSDDVPKVPALNDKSVLKMLGK